MAGKRDRPRTRKSKKDIEFKNEGFVLSFTMDEVKEKLRSIGEKLLKWIIEGAPTQRREKVHEMSASVEEIRKFLIEKKKRLQNTKSSRQLKTLETISPLLDSANYLKAVVKDYLDKGQGQTQDMIPEDHQDINLNESVDMFLEEKHGNLEETSHSQKNTLTDEETQDTHSLRPIPSRSILKLANSETLGIAKKISFAKKATKVYEDNETSQISLAKSSPSVKSVDDSETRDQKSLSTSTETGGISERLETVSKEDIFEDSESIVNSSFQEDISATKSRKLFISKNLLNFNTEFSAKGCTSDKHQTNDLANSQRIELDPLLSQESSCIKQVEGGTTKVLTDVTLPFHNFVLTLPQDSSGSETSLDAKVNMAINLVSTKPKTSSDVNQPSLSNKIETALNSTSGIIPSTVTDFRWLEPVEHEQEETARNSTEGIIPASVTCIDPRWLQPMEFNQGTLSPWFEENKLPSEVLEDAFSHVNLLPPFDDHHQNLGEQHKPSILNSKSSKQENNNFLSASSTITQTRSTSNLKLPTAGHSVTETLESKEKDTKNKPENDTHKSVPTTTGNMEKINLQSNSTQQKNEVKLTVERFRQTRGTILPMGYFEALRDITMTETMGRSFQISPRNETCDSHKLAEVGGYKTHGSSSGNSGPPRSTQKPDQIVERSREIATKPGFTNNAHRDTSKIAKLRRFGSLWSNPSSLTASADTEIERPTTSSTPKTNVISTKGRNSLQAEDGVESDNTKYAQQQGSKTNENQCSLNKNPQREVSGGIRIEKTSGGKSKKKPTFQHGSDTNTYQKSIDIRRSINNPLSTPLPDTVLVDPTGKDNVPEYIDSMNTSSMICETSARETSSHSRLKPSQLQQKKINPKPKQRKRGAGLKLKSSLENLSQTVGSEEQQGKRKKVLGLEQHPSQPLSTSMREHENATQGNPKSPTISTRGRKKTARAAQPKKSSKKQSVLNSTETPENTIMDNKNNSSDVERKNPNSQQSAEKQDFGLNEPNIWHPPHQEAQQFIPHCNQRLQQGPNPPQIIHQGPSGQNGSQLFSHSNAVFERPQLCSNSNQHSTDPSFLQFVQLCAPSDYPKSHLTQTDTSNTETPHIGAVYDPKWLPIFQKIKNKSHTTSNDHDQNSFNFFAPQAAPATASHELENEFDFMINATNNQTNWVVPSKSLGDPYDSTGRSQVFPSASQHPNILQEPKEDGARFDPIGSPNITSRNCNIFPNVKDKEGPSLSIQFPSTLSLEQVSTEKYAQSINTKRQSDYDEGMSPKIRKWQGNETYLTKYSTDNISPFGTQGTQGTEVLFEECEILSWASNDFPSIETIDSEVADVGILDSQEFQAFLIPDPPDNTKTLEPTDTTITEAEKIINSVEWVRRIPESELVEASNIEELINDSTFIW